MYERDSPACCPIVCLAVSTKKTSMPNQNGKSASMVAKAITAWTTLINKGRR
ncbi:MAG TPA: hypothetical protein PKV17_05440 [Aquabacterium sp.]|nr:hypothetical protein [Aquabacterium sp.]HRH28208.1 hypothetical protein [Aquabacterium sp.]